MHIAFPSLQYPSRVIAHAGCGVRRGVAWGYHGGSSSLTPLPTSHSLTYTSFVRAYSLTVNDITLQRRVYDRGRVYLAGKVREAGYCRVSSVLAEEEIRADPDRDRGFCIECL